MQLGVASERNIRPIAVLHVDDDPSLCELAAVFLQEVEPVLRVTPVTSVEAAFDALDERTFDCVVSDYDMPDMTGLDLLEGVRERDGDIPFILFTGKGSEEIASKAIRAGVTDYLQKSRGVDQFTVLANRIVNAVSKYRAEATLEQRARQQAALATLARLAITGVPPDQLLDTTCEEVVHALGVDGALCCSLSAGASMRVSAVGGEPFLAVGDRLPTGKRSQAGYTLIACEPVVAEPDESRFTDEALADVLSRVSVIVGDPDEPWGVLLAGSHAHRSFTPEDVFFLRSVADLLATALIARTTREPVYVEETDLDALVELVETMTAPEPFADRLAAALDLGCSYLGVRFGFFTHLDEETQTVLAAAGDHDLLQPGQYGPVTESYCRKVLSRGELLAVHDAVAAGWVEDHAYEVFGLGCYVGEEVVVAGDTYGTICFADRDPREDRFTPIERSFVRCLSQFVSRDLEGASASAAAAGQTAALDTIAWALDEHLDDAFTVLEGALTLDGDPSSPVGETLDRLVALGDALEALARYSQPVETPEPVALDRVAREAWERVDAPADRLTVEAVELRGDADRLRTLFEVAFAAVTTTDPESTVTIERIPTGFRLRTDTPAFFESGFAFDAEPALWPVRAIATAHGYTVAATDATLTFTPAAIDSLAEAKANQSGG
ncbi:response regulator [Natronomonas sp. EA1]|uniref:GAF domain-containing protein n=1 Tax=Natronomonas sp. EA1 TaxID=3421655 RepID=UPI003EBD8F84